MKVWITIYLSKRKLLRSYGTLSRLDNFRNDRVVLSENIRRKGYGSLSYRGRIWSARNISDRDLKEGETVTVIRQTESELDIRPESGIVEN